MDAYPLPRTDDQIAQHLCFNELQCRIQARDLVGAVKWRGPKSLHFLTCCRRSGSASHWISHNRPGKECGCFVGQTTWSFRNSPLQVLRKMTKIT